MKRIFSFLFVALVALTLAACKKDGTFVVDIFIYEYSDTYIGTVRSAMNNLLKEHEGNIKYYFHDAKSSQEDQMTQIDNAIARGTDLLVVNIVETESGQTVVNKAKENNLPVIFFNREVSDEVINSYDKAAFIGTDPDEAGYMQGQLIADILLADYDKFDLNGDGKISYVMLRADLDNPEANGRTKYSVLEANRLLEEAGKPALKQIGEDYNASWQTSKAHEAMQNFLKSNPFNGDDPIELVIANNDDMALGAIQALNEVGYNTGKENDPWIPVVGVDATATAQAAIKAGKMSGTVKQDAQAMAECIVAFILNTAEGKSYLDGLDYEFESGVDKVRIPYAIYTGDE